MKVKRVLETCLYAADLEAAEAFYTEIFGLEVFAKAPGRHVFFRCGQAMLLIFNPEATSQEAKTPHGTTGGGHVCFQIRDDEIPHWRDWLKSKGVAIEDEITWSNGARSIYFRDPAGNCLEVASPRLWGLPEL